MDPCKNHCRCALMPGAGKATVAVVFSALSSLIMLANTVLADHAGEDCISRVEFVVHKHISSVPRKPEVHVSFGMRQGLVELTDD